MTTIWDLGASTASIPKPQIAPWLPPIHVLITSAPWRRSSLTAVLGALQAQVRPPTSILLVLDGGTENRLAGYDAVPLHVEHREVGRGPGHRWWHRGLDHIGADDIVVTLDDDLVPYADFVARAAALVLQKNAVITWHGWKPPSTEGALHHDPPSRDLDVTAFGCGVAAGRWRWFEPVRRHPLARAVFDCGPAADDDALLALDLYERGVRVVRPAGPPPVTELSSSRASDAGHKRHGVFRHGQRLALALACDAPICDHLFPPPAATAPGFLQTLADVETWYPSRAAERTAHVLRRALAEAASSADTALASIAPFADVLEPWLRPLRPGARILEVELGPWSYWLGLYCAVRGLDRVVVSRLPELRERPELLYAATVAIAARDVPAPAARFALAIVSPYHDLPAGVDAEKVVQL